EVAPASPPAGEAASRRLEVAEDGAPPAAGTAARQERQRSSPLARRMARELGVDLQGVQGSGPQGRIIAKDIKERGGEAPSPVRHDESIPLSAMRRTIAKRLAESIGPIPHLSRTAASDATSLGS